MSGGLLDKLISNEIFDELRSFTVRSKMKRLGLPAPGTLVRVRSFVSLTTMTSGTSLLERSSSMQRKGSLLIVIFVDTMSHMHWHYQQKNVIDPVEIVFLTESGQLASTGVRAGGDVMAPFEALCC